MIRINLLPFRSARKKENIRRQLSIFLLSLILAVVAIFGVNFFLGIASGVIHGLRLNVIEFFNWGLREEGTLYKPFKQSEDNSWNR